MEPMALEMGYFDLLTETSDVPALLEIYVVHMLLSSTVLAERGELLVSNLLTQSLSMRRGVKGWRAREKAAMLSFAAFQIDDLEHRWSNARMCRAGLSICCTLVLCERWHWHVVESTWAQPARCPLR